MRRCIGRVAHCNYILMWTIFLYFLLSVPTPGYGSPNADSRGDETIVIDPGHGGDNHGAIGRDGTFEKDLALKLSRMIAEHLQQKFRVLLTRNNDRDLPLADRAALANHHKADLFISIHMAGAFRKDATGSLILYYAPPQKKFFEPETKVTQLPNTQPPQALKWDNVQQNHLSTSRTLAEKLRAELHTTTDLITPSVDSAPLYVLAGADMPALYIEPFHLTHPDSEEKFQDDENMKQLSSAIATAITAIMQTK